VNSGNHAAESTPPPTRTGYTFAGWYSDSLVTNKFSFSTPITAAITLFAKWTANQYTVTFNKNDAGATGTMSAQTIASGSSANLTLNGFTKAGWTFSGWATTSSGIIAYTDGANFAMGTVNDTLYAKWTINQYTLTYTGNGNTGGTAPSEVTQNYQTTFTVAGQGNLVRSGYQFAGWNTKSNGGGTSYVAGIGTFTMRAGNDTLYAKWAALVDADGNVYTTVSIGSQTWMVENLKTTKFNDGTSIPLVKDSAMWINLSSPAFCWYNNDSTNKAAYGAIYNWYAVSTSKLAPTGWHVPSDSEWSVLTTYLGGDSVAGGSLKEAGLAHWLAPNAGATNSSGLSALPGGYRGEGGLFYWLGGYGNWWPSTEFDANNSWYRGMGYLGIAINHTYANKTAGFSVRCIRN
jgi:uncharacterized protein (TIGR02145 family)/uncharacterized repeat protein (TIGR02543 family)